MTDEVHLNLNGFVNKKNFRYWLVENPRTVNENELHTKRVAVWCAIMATALLANSSLKTKKAL